MRAGGGHRLATVVRCLSVLWVIGWALYVPFGPHQFGYSMREWVLTLIFVLAPFIIGFGWAWILDVTPPRRRYRPRERGVAGEGALSNQVVDCHCTCVFGRILRVAAAGCPPPSSADLLQLRHAL